MLVAPVDLSGLVGLAPEPAVLPSAPTREQIERLEGEMLAIEGQGGGVTLQTTHHFAPGLYARELFIPAGACLIGARHKTRHLIEFLGDITVWHEGQEVRLTGRHVLVSEPGAKRVGFAHEDTICISFHPNPDDITDVRQLEERLVEEAHKLQANRTPSIETEHREALE